MGRLEMAESWYPNLNLSPKTLKDPWLILYCLAFEGPGIRDVGVRVQGLGEILGHCQGVHKPIQ